MRLYKFFIRNLLRFSLNTIVLLVCTLLCLAAVDAVIVFFGLDIDAVSKTVYTFEGNLPYCDAEIYRPSEDTERLYELSPGAKATSSCLRHPDDVDQNKILFSVDRFGFRSNGPNERTKKKPDGVFRIVTLGGSNTFGYFVSDNQTWPAQLERVLNEKTPGRFEVWNAGLSSYNMAQKTAYAKQIIKDYEPDLLLFQYFNVGRRAFLGNGDYLYFFRRNKELWSENAPLIWFDSDPVSGWHQILVRNWVLYRLCVCEYNSCLVDFIRNEPGVDVTQLAVFDRIFNKYFSPLGDNLSASLFSGFISSCQSRKHPKTAMIVNCALDQDRFQDRFQEEFQKRFFVPGLPLFFIHDAVCKDGQSVSFCNIHPPSQVYEWYGEKIADWLIKEKLVPCE